MQHCFYAALVFFLSVNCLQAEDRIFSISNLLDRQMNYSRYGEMMKTYDGSRVLGTVSQVVELKDTASQAPLQCKHKRFFCFCDSPFASIRFLSFAPAPYDHTIVRICDVETGEEWVTFEGFEDGVSYAAFMSNGKILTVSDDETVRIWDTRSGKELHRLEHPQAIRSVLISSDGKKIVTLMYRYDRVAQTYDNVVRTWDAETGEELHSFGALHNTKETVHVISPNGNKIITRGLKVWDVESEEELYKLEWQADEHGGRKYEFLYYSHDILAFSPDGSKIVASRVTSPYSTKIWDAKSGEELLTLEGAFSAFSPDGKKLITRDLRIWDVESGSANFGRELQKLDTPNGGIEFVAFLSDGEKIVTVSNQRESGLNNYFVEIWDTESGEKLESNRLIGLSSLDSLSNGIVLSPNGTAIATVGGDKTFQLWCVHSGRLLQKWVGYEYYGLTASGGVSFGSPGILNSIAFSPDGTKVVMWGKEYRSFHW